MKAKSAPFEHPHSRTTCDTYRYTPWEGVGDGLSSSPLILSLDPRGPRAPGRCLRLTETHRLIDGEPDALWDWEAEAGQCS